jgi:hypothetical protein
MAWLHMGAGQGYGVQGRGAWILDGLAGAFEGFLPAKEWKKSGEIDPGACWRLAVAKGLHEAGKLLPWDQFLDLDRAKAEEVPRETLEVAFGGANREAKNVDVVAAQATALVVAILKAEKGGGPKKLAELLTETLKRDSLPDLEKALGWKRARLVEETERAMAAAHGRE